MIGSDMTCLHCTHWPAAACKWLAVEAARCRPFHMYASSTLFCLLRTSMVYLPVNASLLMDHRPTRPTAPPLWAAWSIHPFSIWLPSTFCLKRWHFFCNSRQPYWKCKFMQLKSNISIITWFLFKKKRNFKLKQWHPLHGREGQPTKKVSKIKPPTLTDKMWHHCSIQYKGFF